MPKREVQVKGKNRKKEQGVTNRRRPDNHYHKKFEILSDLVESSVSLSPDITYLPELLAPCGSCESVSAAIEGGADAIYLGGKQFNARINANNFDNLSLCEAVKVCHSHGVKAYVTVNTLVYDKELPDALSHAAFIRNIDADGIIVADGGLAYLISRMLPDVPLHASTQMSGHNLEAARRLYRMGFSRMVCAREMSFDDIKYLCENSPIEIETFVHGALCVSRSGQCLMSSLIGGRSGNRGECAQPCRLPYNGRYSLSLKDFCLAGHITDLISTGVASLKIEGRMKTPEYVYSVTKIYRQLLDEKRNADAGEIKRLENIFSRGGFTDGYFTDRVGNGMFGVRREEDKFATAEEMKNNKPMYGNLFSHSDDVFDKKNSSDEQKKVSVEFSAKELQKKIVDLRGCATHHENVRSARFLSPERIPKNAYDFFDVIYLPPERFSGNAANGIVMPAAMHDSERAYLLPILEKCRKNGAEHCLIGNIGYVSDAVRMGFVLHGDYRLNVTNSLGFAFYKSLGDFEDIILSPELILAQIRDIKQDKSVIVYGKLPLMTVEFRCGVPKLTDRKNVVFPVAAENNICGMRNRSVIYNGFTTWMADRAENLEEAKITNTHFIFTDETQSESYDVIERYKSGCACGNTSRIRRIK